MKIKQFEDPNLSQYSYAILSDCTSKVILIDPSRDVSPYLEYAREHHAEIAGVIETHPHADFISSHLECGQTLGATLYCSRLQEASYPHLTFDDGDEIELGKITLKAWNTPGHSPDSISVVLEHEGKDKAVFTGDTLFIGDCGRPDLREDSSNIDLARETLAKQMYHSLRDKLMQLDDDVLVYPAHGAGSLCGKALSKAASSTIGAEKASNWSLQPYSETAFVTELIAEQPFVPAYFPYDVAVNRQGAGILAESLKAIAIGGAETVPEPGIVIIDGRSGMQFRQGHLEGAVNLQEAGKFETWLGSIVAPHESYYLVAGNELQLNNLLARAARIGYESFIRKAWVIQSGSVVSEELDVAYFKTHKKDYTIVDLRNSGETNAGLLFDEAILIPLHQLRERVSEIPTNKPVVVHCAGGYRSAAGVGIVANALGDKTKVYDLGEAVSQFY